MNTKLVIFIKPLKTLLFNIRIKILDFCFDNVAKYNIIDVYSRSPQRGIFRYESPCARYPPGELNDDEFNGSFACDGYTGI